MDLTWIAAALWLGLLTAISPCPLASNLAAIGFLGKEKVPRTTMMGGLLYTLGRSLAYLLLALVLQAGLLSAPGLSRFLQSILSPLLGPLLVLTGLILLGWLKIPGINRSTNEDLWTSRRERWGLLAALPMGFVLALAFCPVSAALFFGSLLPLGLDSGHLPLSTLLYGVGTALPVIVFSGILAWSRQSLGQAFSLASKLDSYLRPGTAWFLIGLGLVLLWTRIWAPLLG